MKPKYHWSNYLERRKEILSKISETKKKQYAEGKIKTPFKKGHKPIGAALKGINKGKRNSLETEFKKGEHRSPKTEYKYMKYTKDNWKELGKSLAYWQSQARKAIVNYYSVSWNDMHKPKRAVIHHISGDITNNNFDNLCIMSASDHARYHYDITVGRKLLI